MKVSIIIPTYKRLEFLQRAVEDVFAQTYADWELIISDDEEGEGVTWGWLKVLVAKDSRVRIIKNEGERHGQSFNVNNALRQCTGEWIKPFYDDDRMHADCIEKMVSAVSEVGDPSVVLVGCRAQRWRCGQYVGDEKNFSRASLELIAQEDCRRAICMYDRWNGRTPQHMFIRRSAIERSTMMPEDCWYKVPVDWVWFSRILGRGSYLQMEEVLVEQHEGEVVSITAGARGNEANLDRELFAAYHDIFDMMSPKEKRGIRWSAIEGQINGIRGIYHLKCGRYKQGLGMIIRMLKSLKASFLVLRWFLQELFPGRFTATRRIVCCARGA